MRCIEFAANEMTEQSNPLSPPARQTAEMKQSPSKKLEQHDFLTLFPVDSDRLSGSNTR